MNLSIKKLFAGLGGAWVLSALVAAFGLMSAGRVAGQTFTTLYTFTALPHSPYTNSDGGNPQDGLILADNTLYGMAFHGGIANFGTLFAVNANGANFTVLHEFTNGADGGFPQPGLVLSGNTLYGTALISDDFNGTGYGTVFAINTEDTNFTTLYSFTNGSDGATPYGGVVLSGNTLYGTAGYGGSSGHGTVFSVSTNGTNFTTLYSFTNGSDGARSFAGLILSGNTLYGTASAGGRSGYGTVFSINTNGTNFTTLYSFTNGSDGALPTGELILSGNTLYGTASEGGTNGNGTVFAVNTNGSNFTTLHIFTNGSDGSTPSAALILSSNTLYGTAGFGGRSDYGTVFAVSTNGTNFTTLYSFTNGSDGAYPVGELTLSGDTFYGTAADGGMGQGTVFSLSFAPQLTINLSGTNVILTWPTNVDGFDYAGFNLESTASLSPPAWSTNLPAPVIVNGHYTVTNPICGTQQFYELSQ